MSKPKPRDWLGRSIGCGVFLFGIAVLVFVFYLSYHLFQKPPAELFAGNPKSSAPNMQELIRGVLTGVWRLILLVVMAIVGGMIANRGIQMYLTVRSGEGQVKEE